jgi:hypothetical protein
MSWCYTSTQYRVISEVLTHILIQQRTPEPGLATLLPAPSPIPSIVTLTSVDEQSSRSKSSKDKDRERQHIVNEGSSSSSKKRTKHHKKDLDEPRPSTVHTEQSVEAIDVNGEHELESKFYPLQDHVSNPDLLSTLIAYLSFGDFCSLRSVSLAIRRTIDEQEDLREVVLARYLASAGYRRWSFEARREPLVFTLNVSLQLALPYACL